MKKILMTLLLPLLTVASLCAQGYTVSGTVKSGSEPLSGVKVTDGVNVVVTKNDGSYTLHTSGRERFVYISTPAGYQAPVRDGVVEFFIPLEPEQPSYDFNLVKKSVDDTNHGFIVIADPQIWHLKELDRLQAAAMDIASTVSSFDGRPFHGICAGDIISHEHSFYPKYNAVMQNAGIPFYNSMGNHDMTLYGRSHEGSHQNYEDIYGPAYYSYNVGKVHYVVLNDNFYIGRDYFYIGYLVEKQLEWLERDLSYVKAGTTVVLCLHIPTTLGEEDRRQFQYGRAGNVLINARHLYAMLEPYDTHIISGHTHTMYNERIRPNLYEHNTAALSGAWWQGSLCTDGTPQGYGVYEVSGGDIKWYYKSTGYPKEYQMRLYAGNDYPDFEGHILANIWNSDSDWRVELLSDEKTVVVMERIAGFDPDARQMYADTSEMDHKWIHPSLSDHYYIAPLPSGGTISVRATDPFGNVYIQQYK